LERTRTKGFYCNKKGDIEKGKVNIVYYRPQGKGKNGRAKKLERMRISCELGVQKKRYGRVYCEERRENMRLKAACQPTILQVCRRGIRV